MKLFKYMKDGGVHSKVWGFWLCEIKSLLSIVLLCFKDGSREAYHSHAFNCVSWVIKGKLEEHYLDGKVVWHKPSIIPFLTYRHTFHKVYSHGDSYVFTLRGRWKSTWQEYLPDQQKFITLKNGRKIVNKKETPNV